MNQDEQPQINVIGETYCQTLGGLIDAIPSAEGQAQFCRITFDAILIQLLNRRGPGDVAAFLRRTADKIDQDARARLQ